MKKILVIVFVFLLFTASFAVSAPWERQGNLYFLTKNTKDFFNARGAGENKFSSKYLTYDKVDFLVRGNSSWNDYGRINLEGNNLFSIPIQVGSTIQEIHFLAGGNFSNSYKNDLLLSLYGENYYYGTVNVIFLYQDGTYKSLSVPVFWDWFHLPLAEWSKDGAKIRNIGNNPVRRNCTIYHMTFVNPMPNQPLKDILVNDSWVSDIPYSDIFAITVKSKDTLDSLPREN